MESIQQKSTVTEINGDALGNLVQYGKQLANIRDMLIGAETRIAFVPEGLVATDLSKFFPSIPDRKRITVNLIDVESFIEYINENKSGATRIFADTSKMPYRFTAAIDYHEPGPDGNPSWITHIVVLTMTVSDEWKAWTERDNKSFEQMDFVNFLQDNRLDIIDPPGARIEEIALTLQLTTGGRCQSKINLNNGSTHIEFKQDVEAKAGADGSLTVPKELRLSISPFLGLEPKEINADLRYKITSGKIVWGYKLMQPQVLVRAISQEAVNTIRENTGIPVFLGSYC